MFESEAVNIMNILLKPGEKLDTHITPVNVFFYVLKGKGKIEVEKNMGSTFETPYLIPRGANCSLCFDLSEVCPTGAIAPAPVELVKMGSAALDKIIAALLGMRVSSASYAVNSVRLWPLKLRIRIGRQLFTLSA